MARNANTPRHAVPHSLTGGHREWGVPRGPSFRSSVRQQQASPSQQQQLQVEQLISSRSRQPAGGRPAARQHWQQQLQPSKFSNNVSINPRFVRCMIEEKKKTCGNGGKLRQEGRERTGENGRERERDREAAREGEREGGRERERERERDFSRLRLFFVFYS